ncbi:MAG: ABC transporter permease [Verrucomicrobiaceae bacterium]|nr:MAG: ABC transporter permease [Verrucomicrobiaceae bacterium]
MRQVNVRKTAPPPPVPIEPVSRKRTPIRWGDEWTQLRTLLRRAFTSKMRNRGNLVLTLLVPPVLAAIIGWALYFTDEGTYDFASAFHIPTYIFISLLVAMFLALMNSVDDIIRDRVILHRERNLDVRLPYYIFAKFSTLAMFSAVQCALFVVVGNSILEVRGMFWPYFIFMFITATSGTSLGLVISSIVGDSKTAANFVPLVLIPQLIFGGALIKYEEMNRDLDVMYTFNRWFSTHPEMAAEREDSKLRIPLISRFVATHYSYEALVVAQAKLNPLSKRQDDIQEQIDLLIAKKNRTPEEAGRLEDLKDTLALLSGMESGSLQEVERRLRRVDRILEGRVLDRGELRSKTSGVTAERLYTNQKITDLVAKAETEQSDYRRQVPVNVFFSPMKHYLLFRIPEISPLGIRSRAVEIHTSVYLFNAMVLVGSSFVLMCALYSILKRQLRPKGL